MAHAATRSLRVTVSFGYSPDNGRRKRSGLRECTRMRYAILDTILEEIREGRIKDDWEE